MENNYLLAVKHALGTEKHVLISGRYYPKNRNLTCPSNRTLRRFLPLPPIPFFAIRN
jgi:hypothetical protein